MEPTAAPRPSLEIQQLFGSIDIYLFDQLARGRFDERRRVLDVGCGEGRNIRYLLANGYECCGIDRDKSALERLRRDAAALGRSDSEDRFVPGEADALPWPDQSFDAVICSALLHFADDAAHFGRMMTEMWRVLAPGGLFFSRLASTIGLDGFEDAAGRRVRLPDGSDRFVVDEAMLIDWTTRLGGTLADPIKTTIVQGQRCMTTWCVWK
jgi:SAM-dependent methyltransferase